MNLTKKLFLITLGFLLLQACAQKTAFRPNGQRLAPEIFDIELRGVDVILLGERHGKASDHEGQLELISKFSDAVLGMEQINQNQNDSLEKYLNIKEHRVEGLETQLNWSKRGWPKFSFYEPLISHANNRGWKVVGLNKSAKELEKSGPKAFAKLSAQEQNELIEEMIKVHPFEMSDDLAKKLAKLQAARDFEMAKKINSELAERKVFVGIMGCGHVRKDRGVPFFLKTMKPDLRVLSLCFHPKSKEVDYIWKP